MVSVVNQMVDAAFNKQTSTQHCTRFSCYSVGHIVKVRSVFLRQTLLSDEQTQLSDRFAKQY